VFDFTDRAPEVKRQFIIELRNLCNHLKMKMKKIKTLLKQDFDESVFKYSRERPLQKDNNICGTTDVKLR